MTISLLEAKANLEELLLKAAAGESVVIALEAEKAYM
jgi:antitoxin (DNA-binding transcriptional repressor) of toxin-antitoxin stability system